MQSKKSIQVGNRAEIYQERVNNFLRRIKQFENEERKKIQQRQRDEIQFETNKIKNETHEKDEQAFGKRHKALQVQTKIKKSRKINEARLSKMKLRFEMIEKVQNQIRNKLVQRTSNGQQYRDLLQKLIIQGMIRMLQENIQVKCLSRDVQIVKQVLPNCERKFAQICEVKTKLTLNPQKLPESDLGGVVLTSFNGKIVCNNTLRARLDYAVQQALPQIRSNLFSVPAAPVETKTSIQSQPKTEKAH